MVSRTIYLKAHPKCCSSFFDALTAQGFSSLHIAPAENQIRFSGRPIEAAKNKNGGIFIPPFENGLKAMPAKAISLRLLQARLPALRQLRPVPRLQRARHGADDGHDAALR